MKHAKRLVSLAVSLALLALLVRSVDGAQLAATLRGIDRAWFAAAMLLFVPQSLAIASRWSFVARPVAKVSVAEAARQVLASNCLNLVLPAKLGDLAKGVFLHRQGHCSLADGLQIVVFEKLLDLAALSAWMLCGWLFVRRMDPWLLGVLAVGACVVAAVWLMYFTHAGARMLLGLVPAFVRGHRKLSKIPRLIESAPHLAGMLHAEGSRRGVLVAWSLAIWMLHLLQIWCFFRAVGADIGLPRIVAEMPAAIFAGLLPLSVAGIGTRDWAIVAIFGGGIPRETLVGAAFLVSLRYIVPAAAGIILAGRYYNLSREAAGSASATQPPDAP